MSRGEYLTEAEIDKFFNECNKNDDNSIDYAEIEAKLDEVHEEIAPDPKEHNLHHKEKDDNARHVFLRGIMQDKDILTKEEFFEVVRSWKIPTQEAPKDKSSETIKAVPIGRRIRAHLAVDGPPYAFLAFVVILMIIFGVWQLVTYLRSETRQALGWGVIVSKATAGVLYPTLFFMILSMSRHLSTFARYSYWISRFVNFDRAQSFHIKISIFALAMGTLHGIGHLTGTFIYSSRPGRQALTAEIVGTARSYREYVATLPGVTGIAALGIFWLIAICSMPWLRSKNYEIFQGVHLLMFPFIGLLMAHGTWSILQPPMLGYWLAFPTLLVVGERLYRLYRGCIKVPAELEILDDDTVAITCKHPAGRPWRYEAGQYVLLQVPQISFFQWHPFTISTCNDNTLSLHIKTDGDWVKKLRSQDISYVGIDGPFGAPAQRFYDYEKTIIVGAGIGVTPFSGILNDLEQKTKDARVDTNTSASSRSRSRTRSRSQSRSRSHSRLRESKKGQNGPAYRCDFHWIVRDKNYYLWFSDLLNRIQRAPLHDNLEVKIVTHLTTKRDKISTVIFRYLLDRHRTEEHPESALTGLLNDTSFGRPDWPDIMREHYQSMKQSSWRGKVGVFFCGAPVVGYIISDQCSILNAKAREDDVDLTYVFMMEVFG